MMNNLPVVQHQVPAVIVAVAEHARFRRQRIDQYLELRAQCVAGRCRQHDAAVGLEEVLDEEVHLPRQLLDVEGNPVGQVVARLEFSAAPLQRRDQRDRLPVERRMLAPASRRRDAPAA